MDVREKLVELLLQEDNVCEPSDCTKNNDIPTQSNLRLGHFWEWLSLPTAHASPGQRRLRGFFQLLVCKRFHNPPLLIML